MEDGALAKGDDIQERLIDFAVAMSFPGSSVQVSVRSTGETPSRRATTVIDRGVPNCELLIANCERRIVTQMAASPPGDIARILK